MNDAVQIAAAAAAMTVDQTDPNVFTLDQLVDALTPAEIEALKEEDLVAAEPEVPAADDPVADAQRTVDEVTQAAQAAQQEQAEPSVPSAPQTGEIEAQIAAYDAKLDELATKYEDGDLAFADFTAQQRALAKEQAALEVQLDQARESVSSAQQTWEQAWYAKVDAHMSQYPELQQGDAMAGFDRALRAVTADQTYAQLTMQQKIDLAHRNLANELAITKGVKIGIPGAESMQEKRQGPRTDARDDAPITLAGINGAPASNVDDGTFAHIERLMETDPIKAEKAVAALSDEQRNAFLNV